MMSTDKQIEASQQNGRLSQGPRTPNGKETSSKNATTHGLFSRQPLLPGEDPEALEALEHGLKAEFQPVGELEKALVDRLVGLTWRLRRIATIEAGVLSRRYFEVLAERSQNESRSCVRLASDLWGVQPMEVLDPEKHEKAVAEAQEYRQEQKSEICTQAEAFVRDCRQEDAISKLSRYENSMQRNLFRALHELQRLQAARRGELVPAPVAVDIDLNVSNTDQG